MPKPPYFSKSREATFRQIGLSRGRLLTIEKLSRLIFDKTGRMPSDSDLAITLATTENAIRRTRERGGVR
jgi:hypothetical protein